MGYYKFNPKNHICSLAWTGLLFASQLGSEGSTLDIVLAPTFMGIPAVFVGVNIRERAEKDKRNKVVNYIDTKKEVTVSQIANLLELSGQESRNILNSLVKEERIEMTNRSEDMAVVYIPAN